MRWRLLRRCLLLSLLGLITSIAVAWSAAARVELQPTPAKRMGSGVAVVNDVIVRVSEHRRAGYYSRTWQLTDTSRGGFKQRSNRAAAEHIRQIGGAAYDEEVWSIGTQLIRDLGAGPLPDRPEIYRLDDVAARGPPSPVEAISEGDTLLSRSSAGWPLQALGLHSRVDFFWVGKNATTGLPARVDDKVSKQGAIEIPWPWADASAQPPVPGTLTLPIRPLPGLAINTIVYALLWAMLLHTPGLARRAIRRAHGCCPTCGYSLLGQPSPGCPECGHGHEAARDIPRPSRA